MAVEIEAKWVAADLGPVRQQLKVAGAKLIYPERLMFRKVFDYPDGRLAAERAWVRVRQDGSRVELTYKQMQSRTLTGMHEHTVGVSDFVQTCALLEATGLVAKSYQETKREQWEIGNCEVSLDTWPWIPSVVEIEGPSEIDVREAAQALHFVWSEAIYGSIEHVYAKYYRVAEMDVCFWPEIVFTPVPDWLKSKKIE